MEYEEKMYDVERIPASDDLVAGSMFLLAGNVTLSGAGKYERGEVLLRTSDGWGKATVSGIATALEAAILAQGIVLEDDEAAGLGVYFTGTFNMRRVKVGSKQLREYDGQEQNAVIEGLRRHKIFLM